MLDTFAKQCAAALRCGELPIKIVLDRHHYDIAKTVSFECPVPKADLVPQKPIAFIPSNTTSGSTATIPVELAQDNEQNHLIVFSTIRRKMDKNYF